MIFFAVFGVENAAFRQKIWHNMDGTKSIAYLLLFGLRPVWDAYPFITAPRRLCMHRQRGVVVRTGAYACLSADPGAGCGASSGSAREIRVKSRSALIPVPTIFRTLIEFFPPCRGRNVIVENAILFW